MNLGSYDWMKAVELSLGGRAAIRQVFEADSSGIAKPFVIPDTDLPGTGVATNAPVPGTTTPFLAVAAKTPFLIGTCADLFAPQDPSDSSRAIAVDFFIAAHPASGVWLPYVATGLQTNTDPYLLDMVLADPTNSGAAPWYPKATKTTLASSRGQNAYYFAQDVLLSFAYSAYAANGDPANGCHLSDIHANLLI